MPPLRSAIVACSALLALTACGGGDEAEKAAGASPAPKKSAPAVAPEFTGALDVGLVAATPLMKSGDCTPDAAKRLVCDEVTGKGYILSGDPRPTQLVEAQTEPNSAGTKWQTTLRFASGAQLGWGASEALDKDGYLVLLADDGETVLLSQVVRTLPEPSVRSNRWFPDATDKAAAWDLVQRLVDQAG